MIRFIVIAIVLVATIFVILDMCLTGFIFKKILCTNCDNSVIPELERMNHCHIPHQKHKGHCVTWTECSAYQALFNSSLETIEQINFIDKLKCTSDMDEHKICCPIHEDHYIHPYIASTGGTKKMTIVSRLPEPVSLKSNINGLASLDVCGFPTTNQKVKGGKICELDEYPWEALLIYDSKRGKKEELGCGGALINENFILTAAHCVVNYTTEFKGNLRSVRLGEYDTTKERDCIFDKNAIEDCADDPIDAPIAKIIVHPKYSSEDYSNYDIALIKLQGTIQYSYFIQPICLPQNNMDTGLTSGTNMLLSGWGRTDKFAAREGIILSPLKLKAIVPIVDEKSCSKAFKAEKLQVHPGLICAGGEANIDTCPGDSGSPLMYFNRHLEKFIAVGITSFGSLNCGTVGVPGVYTRIDKYMDWIESSLD